MLNTKKHNAEEKLISCWAIKNVKFCSPWNTREIQKGTKASTSNPTRCILHDFTARQTGKKWLLKLKLIQRSLGNLNWIFGSARKNNKNLWKLHFVFVIEKPRTWMKANSREGIFSSFVNYCVFSHRIDRKGNKRKEKMFSNYGQNTRRSVNVWYWGSGKPWRILGMHFIAYSIFSHLSAFVIAFLSF